ncbi:DUF5107 domain-containing protein [Paenibacillus sp. OV219]|uniref:DUF5107 domain-containing protein n=1 Tax=Paenibacillus sp. OV219 TaxID=1884377 RepID=UPI0008B04FC9|nr:DUF5107 domain-containing protein [Paenibacillus sp. OV219]SEO66650.1 protein of unknown function [Paenibacillus sp. OV219]
MLKLTEWQETLLYHPVVPCGPVPTVCDGEGIYPYESFCETAERPVLRKFRMMAIENDWMKVTVCPDLGGKIHSIFLKASSKEILFDAGAVRPVRILPRMAFISGGIEVSFPIAHTPVQVEVVHAEARQIGDRLYIWCGEREVRYGMHWTVEYSLGEHDRYLTQRATFVNKTSEAHSWMSWSNAALPARADSQFHFPAGRVLRHADILEEIEWSRERGYTLSDFDRMQGFFWKSTDCNAFGMYTPSLSSGLYHIADPAETPGIKLWLYGLGKHEDWAHSTAIRRESYVEIQAGPLLEQADNNMLQPGARHMHTEFWIPSAEPLEIREFELPAPQLIPIEEVPLFDLVPRSGTAPWLVLAAAYASRDASALAAPPAAEDCVWPPPFMEQLGEALLWAAETGCAGACDGAGAGEGAGAGAGTGADADAGSGGAIASAAGGEREQLWRYYYAVWLAGRGLLDEAIAALAAVELDCGYALLGRLLRVCRRDYAGSRAAYASIRSAAWSLHPQLFFERDVTLAQFGAGALEEREHWFAQVDSLQDDALVERRASFLLDRGGVAEAKTILDRHAFGKVHQRYDRSQLWQRVAAVTGELAGGASEEVLARLGEDDLAVYGAYRVSEQKQE